MGLSDPDPVYKIRDVVLTIYQPVENESIQLIKIDSIKKVTFAVLAELFANAANKALTALNRTSGLRPIM